MANPTTEPRALAAALAAPAFTTRGAGAAMHAANRHVERWAPEAGVSKVGSMRSLGFVDRLVAPWIETAQRSASMRLFNQYQTGGLGERQGGAVSWVFPRPWYQDELDWMAAARQAPQGDSGPSPTMFTTRGTYVPPVQAQRQTIAAPRAAMPTGLYEYVAPSLSIAAPAAQMPFGVGYGGETMRSEAYSPLVPLAAVQAAELMSRAIAPLVTTASGAPGAPGRMSPALRSVLTTMLERATTARAAPAELMPNRLAAQAPQLETPPAPRGHDVESRAASGTSSGGEATQLAERYAEHHAKIVDLQRIARRSAERELASRAESQTAAIAERSEAELRQRTQDARTAPSAPSGPSGPSAASGAIADRATAERAQVIARTAAERATAERATAVERVTAAERALSADRARQIEEQVERTSQRAVAGQRLHEEARTQAAAHARASELTQAAVAAQVSQPAPRAAAPRAPAEVTAAIASLPPELAAYLGHRPERAMQAIGELNEALRTVELIARSTASGVPFEATRGPRLMMPSGLGGLVAAVDRAQTISERPAMLAGQRPAAAPIGSQPAPPRSDARVPTLPWLTGPALGASSTSGLSMRGALGATAATAPAALSHVAWADRWLARFAGAAPQSLDVLQAAAGGSPSARLQALSEAAPHAVFVAPMFEADRADTVRFDAAGHPTTVARTAGAPAAPAQLAPAQPQAKPAQPAVIRYDDNAETPDDVFAQIAAGATRSRGAQSTATVASSMPAATSPSGAVSSEHRFSTADAVAHAAPVAPNAGLFAQLASSPFAPALRHLIAMPSAASFDVRALFGDGLSATYLAGLLAPSAHEIATSSALAPSWASWLPSAAGDDGPATSIAERAPIGWDPAYVAPELAASDVGAGTTATAGGVVGADPAAAIPALAGMAPSAVIAALAPLTTLRTALLSWNLETTAAGETVFAPDAPSVLGRHSTALSSSAARSMIEAMSLPMLGDSASASADHAGSWAAPGMIAERAHGWSVAQERSSADLALDFVPPELVLAARVYGLGPAEAAQAARLAIAGPGQLTAMAGTVDRTFVQAMAIEADRRAAIAEGRAPSPTSPSAPSAGYAGATTAALTTAYPTASGDLAAALGQLPAAQQAAMSFGATSPGAAFGVERRPPRGAFLWPAGTVGALGLSAAGPDSQQSMSVAALELLAAQAVAEIGTYAALGEHATYDTHDASETAEIAAPASRPGERTSIGATERAASPGATSAQTFVTGRAPSSTDRGEPTEQEVLATAASMIPTGRRARFDALYLALSQTPNGQTWSPAARAARALALAGRGDSVALSARDRAATAWDVLPIVYATDGMVIREAEALQATPAMRALKSSFEQRSFVAPRGGGRRGGRAAASVDDQGDELISVDARPGLGALSARAGEALGSYVTPTIAAPSSTSSSYGGGGGSSQSRETPAMRASSATHELVRPGRPAGRFGGGEVEIPTWFEAAARKMLEDRSGGVSDGMSMAELTLVTAAPSSHVAASTRSAPSASPPSPSHGGDHHDPQSIDVEQVAGDVYREILTMMDAARARNGEPYL